MAAKLFIERLPLTCRLEASQIINQEADPFKTYALRIFRFIG